MDKRIRYKGDKEKKFLNKGILPSWWGTKRQRAACRQTWEEEEQEWLNEEDELISSVNWIVPEGVTSDQELVTGSIGHIKIETLQTGSFKIVCDLGTTELGLSQNNAIPMVLKVY